MKFSGRLPAVIQLLLAIGLVCDPQFAVAYDHPLSDEAVRDAYFVGQDVKTVNAFLSVYAQHPPVPKSGPHVAEIALSTPYAQVVEVSAQHSVGYSDLQAAEDYRKRGDFIAVRVKVLFTPTYTNRADDFWRDVSVGLIQKKHMAATKVDGQPIYSADTYGGMVLIGADVTVQFSVTGVRSDSLQVEVIPTEGAPVHATFDLSKLR
jgi:hypothetical protein